MNKPDEFTVPGMTAEENTAALRFLETCEDGQAYDVPKPMMKRLAELGMVVHKGFGVYEGTPALDEFQKIRNEDLTRTAAHKKPKP